jgi:hypothetical protein
MLFGTLMPALVLTPTLVDLVLVLRASEGLGYPMALSGKTKGLLIGYMRVWVLPLFCT